MSDGPHKSLPMRVGWKKFAKCADKAAFEPDQLADLAIPALEGDWRPERMVILEFPSRQNATDFLNDPEFQGLLALRHRTTTSHLVLVDGCA